MAEKRAIFSSMLSIFTPYKICEGNFSTFNFEHSQITLVVVFVYPRLVISLQHVLDGLVCTSIHLCTNLF